MKISKKLIGLSVASLGALASIGGAFALYQQNAEPVSFGISAGTYAGSGGSVTYKINGAGGNSEVAPAYLRSNGTNGGTGLSTEFTQVKYEMALGGTYAGNNAQNYIVGNVGVSLTNVPEAYRGKLSVWVEIAGYVENSLGANTYGHTFMNSDYAITEENQTYVANRDVAVSSDGTQKLVIYLKYNLEGVDTLTQNEASLGYSLAVTWTEPASFNPAYVKCNRNEWSVDEGYAMLPNINKTTAGWEWIYNNYPGAAGTTKCFIHENDTDKWSQNDFVPDAEKSYNITWSGVADAEAHYEVIA